MDARAIVTGLDQRIHLFDLHGRVLESFPWCGMHCVIMPGAYGANGYVRLPKRTMRALRGVRDIGAALGFDRRLTYLDRRTRWVGFDTGMTGDLWALDEAWSYSIDPESARVCHTVQLRQGLGVKVHTQWTLHLVRLHTMYLAELAAAYRYRHRLRWLRRLTGRPDGLARPEGGH